MSKIVPAILVDSPERYRQQLRIVRQLTNRFQLDLIDAGFSDKPTITADQVESAGDLRLDVDLMSAHPDRIISSVYKLRPKTVIFHFFKGVDLMPLIERTKSNGLQVGLALEPDHSLDLLGPFIDKLDIVQLMGHRSGLAGLPFDETVLASVHQIREIKDSLILAIDGGVNLEVIPRLVEAGFDIIYVNSYIFGSDNPLVQYANLLEATS